MAPAAMPSGLPARKFVAGRTDGPKNAQVREYLSVFMEGSAEAYREQARKIVELAEKADEPAVRAELFALAERFRRLADYIEGQRQRTLSFSFQTRLDPR
jgi:hypothetical protein